jgi:hypothetical protein
MAKNKSSKSQALKKSQKTNSAKDLAPAPVKEVSQVEQSQGTQSKVGTKDLSQLPLWNCRIDGTPKEAQWTVGEVYAMLCEGTSVNFLSTELQFKNKENAEYQIRILDVEKQTENSLTLKATSYNTGQLNMDQLYIADQGVEVLKVTPLQLNVKTLIEQPEQKPFGPIMALKMSYPSWLWMSFVGVLLISLFFTLFKLRRRTQMKKVVEELKQHNTALGSFNQFNKDIRTLSRQYVFGGKQSWPVEKKIKYVESLDQIFRMYLLREFIVPALDWNTNLILKTIAKYDKKRFDQYSEDIKSYLKELDRAKVDYEKLKDHDCKQLTQMALKTTQSIWKVRK